MEHISALVRQNLYLYVLRTPNQALEENSTVSEGGSRLLTRFSQPCRKNCGRVNHSHSSSATAERGFDHQWKAH
jgi:hypothetical protein